MSNPRQDHPIREECSNVHWFLVVCLRWSLGGCKVESLGREECGVRVKLSKTVRRNPWQLVGPAEEGGSGR